MPSFSQIVDSITGAGGRDAARKAKRILAEGAIEGSEIRAQGGREAFDFLNQQLSPFAGAFGSEDIANLNALATDPRAQVDFLTNNPLFEALRGQAREATFRTQSAGGALGSSGTDEILQNQFLALGNDLINQQINRQLPLMQGAQSATTNLATGGGNLLASIQDALARGREDEAQALATGAISEQNAIGDGTGNLFGLGGAIFGGGGIRNVVKGLF